MTLFAFLLSSGGVSAWSNQTYIRVCDEAVKYVWGSEVLERCVYSQNMSFQSGFCGVIRQQAGETAYQSCVKENGFVHPAVMPYAFFDDLRLHRDYSTCPIRSENDAKHLCSGDKNNPASNQAVKWFRAAENAADECTRVYSFCIGSDYLADSYNPLNHILYGVDMGACGGLLDKKVENRITEPSPVGWSVSQVCTFRYMQERAGQVVAQRYAQDFMVSNKTFADLTNSLIAYGNVVYNATYPSTTTTVITTTTEISESSTTTTTAAKTTTTQYASIPPTTKVAEETGGGSWLTLVVAACILVAVWYLAGGRTGHAAKKHALGVHEHGGLHHRHAHQARQGSLRNGEREEGIVHEDRGRSRLGRAGRGKGEEE